MSSQQGYIGTLPSLYGAYPQTLSAGVSVSQQVNSLTNITTYGALVLPFDVKEFLSKNKPQNDPKTVNNFKGKLRSALNLSPNESLIKGALKSPIQTFETLSEYMKDDRAEISKLTTVIGSKFSGIAVAQALSSGKVSSKEALDYLFMGFAPALGVTGSLFGYSGLTQLKDALSNGSIDVGSFLSGFTRTLKGAVDLKDLITRRQARIANNIVEFDLTLSHSENYQSETPDRRVQSGQSLNEYVHNMPETFDVQCALQEGKRYSKAEFRAIIQQVRNTKGVVSLILGDEMFDNLIITNFAPSHDCTKSGMDYTLSLKKIVRSDIDTTTEVTISDKPDMLDDDSRNASGSGSVGGLGTSVKDVSVPNIKVPEYQTPEITTTNFKSIVQRVQEGESWLSAIQEGTLYGN